MSITLLVTHFRRAEINAFGRLRIISQRDRPLFSSGNGIGKRDDHILVRRLIIFDFFRRGYGMDVQVYRVQLDFMDRLENGLETDLGLALDGTLLEIGSNIDGEVKHLHVTVSSVISVTRRI